MKKFAILFPLLLALYPILFLYSQNLAEVTFHDISFIAGAVLGFTILIYFLAHRIIKNKNKAQLSVYLILLLFFSYGHVFTMINGLSIGSLKLDKHRYLLVLYGFLFCLSILRLLKSNRDFGNLVKGLHAFASILILFPLFSIGFYYLSQPVEMDVEEVVEEMQEEWLVDDTLSTGARDVYYIILDGYASSSILEEIYHYDNSEFEESLEQKGFYIADSSRSNYMMTFLSLASSLNMQYINEMVDTLDCETKDRSALYHILQDNVLKEVFQQNGYKFVHLSSNWGPTDYNPYADINFHKRWHNEFFMVFVNTTMLRALNRWIIGERNRESILSTFSTLQEIPELSGPKFVFAHIVSPHPPYLFDADGGPVPKAKMRLSGGKIWGRKNRYINQLIFINSKVEAMVDEILDKSEIEPIIVLQADHGSASTFANPETSSWEDPTPEMVEERSHIFNAYLLPEEGNALLYDSISPVNSFRVILNYYFGADYELLDDLSFYSTYDCPYNLVEIDEYLE